MSGAPRIILFDLETLPDLDEALKHWPGLSNYPGLTLRAQLSSIICFGYKEFGKEHKSKVVSAWDFKKRWLKDVNDDYMVCKAAYKVLKDADCVVTWNGKGFDEKHLRTRMEFHKLPPLPPIAHVDLKQVSKSKMYFLNNRLQTVGEWLIGKGKREHEGWNLWVRVHGGVKKRVRDEAAEKKMSWYCDGDVLLLEDCFRRLRKHSKEIPNHNLFSLGETNVCPGCGSTRLRSLGRRYTATTAYRRYVCIDCGKASRTNKDDKFPRNL